MSDETHGSAPQPSPLPDTPSLDWLRKQAKRRLAELRQTNAAARLADAQFDLAKQYGFPSWRALKAHLDTLTVDGRLFEAAKQGDLATLTALLDQHPDKLPARNQPYEHTLLHVAAFAGRLPCVNLLLARGLDANVREKGDNTYPMHWAAAAGHLEVVRRLADAGGDVIGAGDDHALDVVGWASCWEGCDDATHRAIVALLLSRGARHHIFSAIAMNDADAVRHLAATDPPALNRRMSRNEAHQTALHFAVRMHRRELVALLLELGVDPLAVDDSGHPAAAYATGPQVDRAIMERIRAMTSGELLSAERGRRPPRIGTLDLMAAVAAGDWQTSERLLHDNPRLTDAAGGALHVMAKRGDAAGVSWLLAHGANANGIWPHWDAEVTPLHVAILGNHPAVVRLLLEGGANPAIKDSKHDGDAMDWARFFKRTDIEALLTDHAARSGPPRG